MLQKNDRVVIIAPAAQFTRASKAMLQPGIDLLESWGLKVDVLIEQEHHFYLAGRDELRQQHLNQALIDSRYKAIFCTRGGYGSARLLKALPAPESVSDKLLVGHSDITTLHLAALVHYPQIKNIHGPNIATAQLLDDSVAGQANRDSLYGVLFGSPTLSYPLRYIRHCSQKNVVEGELIGGCLSILCSLLGTKYLPSFAGKILLLEDVGEAPYKIDRMLQQLINAGVIDQLNGVVFGAMDQCIDPYNDLEQVILDVLAGCDISIGYGWQTGHGALNYSIPLGSKVIMDSHKQEIRIIP